MEIRECLWKTWSPTTGLMSNIKKELLAQKKGLGLNVGGSLLGLIVVGVHLFSMMGLEE